MAFRGKLIVGRKKMNKVVTDNCWLFAGKIDKSGHGRIYAGQINGVEATRPQAYRVMYENVIGPIPEGLHIDHLCEVPQCINPKHLEPVTFIENIRRFNQRRTQCLKGHYYAETGFRWRHETRRISKTNPTGRTRICLGCEQSLKSHLKVS